MTNFQQTNAPRDLEQPIGAAGSFRSKALPALQQASTFQRDTGQPRFSPQTAQAIWLLLGLLEALFALRFVFKLAGASGAVLEISTLIAMAAYGLLGWLLARAVWMIFYSPYANIGATPASIVEQGRPWRGRRGELRKQVGGRYMAR